MRVAFGHCSLEQAPVPINFAFRDAVRRWMAQLRSQSCFKQLQHKLGRSIAIHDVAGGSAYTDKLLAHLHLKNRMPLWIKGGPCPGLEPCPSFLHVFC